MLSINACLPRRGTEGARRNRDFLSQGPPGVASGPQCPVDSKPPPLASVHQAVVVSVASLQNSVSSSLATWTLRLDRLGGCLGEDHDLFLLHRFLRRKGEETLSKKERDGLLRWIQNRRRELLESVSHQGRGVFAANSSRFQAELRRPGRTRLPTPLEDAAISRTAVALRVDQVPMISRRATPPSVRLRGRPSGSRNSALGDKPKR